MDNWFSWYLLGIVAILVMLLVLLWARRELRKSRYDRLTKLATDDHPHGITVVYDDGEEQEGHIRFLGQQTDGVLVYALDNIGRPGAMVERIIVQNFPPGTAIYPEDTIYPVIEVPK